MAVEPHEREVLKGPQHLGVLQVPVVQRIAGNAGALLEQQGKRPGGGGGGGGGGPVGKGCGRVEGWGGVGGV